jgi:predicted DNA-binding antitoxin AbrB/MazE fold protein
MTITVEAVYENGVLKPVRQLPLQEHQRVEIMLQAPGSGLGHADYLEFLRSTAGAWQGHFERPPQGDYETRNRME